MDEKISLLASYIKECENIVFFGGAGVSTESGIPDFRSKDGLYSQDYAFSFEKILCSSFFYLNPFVFFDFYRNKMDVRDKEPNFTHTFLTTLEERGKLKAIITQNIDGLHEKAGSKNIIALHGSIYNNYCIKCNKRYDVNFIFESKKIPTCSCGFPIKPDIVLYGEELSIHTLSLAIEKIKNADMLIVGGTSLSVFPANTLLSYFHGKRLVIINMEKTDFDKDAHLVIHHKIGEVFKLLSQKSV